MVNSSSVKNLNIDIVNRVKIPVVSLEKQKQIVSILDKFSTLVNDIKEGLPAEIELRRKQYEYYRDKLLTFDTEE
jgi:type I restriction enzyme S subunit